MIDAIYKIIFIEINFLLLKTSEPVSEMRINIVLLKNNLFRFNAARIHSKKNRSETQI